MLSTIYSEHAQKLFFILISFTRDLLVSRFLHKYTHAATKSIAFLYNTLWLITAQIQYRSPRHTFNNIPVKKLDELRHLGIILDSKLACSTHIKPAISKTREGIGLLKYLSQYLPSSFRTGRKKHSYKKRVLFTSITFNTAVNRANDCREEGRLHTEKVKHRQNFGSRCAKCTKKESVS